MGAAGRGGGVSARRKGAQNSAYKKVLSEGFAGAACWGRASAQARPQTAQLGK
jgi:hypothetical protein